MHHQHIHQYIHTCIHAYIYHSASMRKRKLQLTEIVFIMLEVTYIVCKIRSYNHTLVYHHQDDMLSCSSSCFGGMQMKNDRIHTLVVLTYKSRATIDDHYMVHV